MTTDRVRNLIPAEHVKPAPEDGWRAADLSDDELVDDAFVEADPESFVLDEPDVSELEDES